MSYPMSRKNEKGCLDCISHIDIRGKCSDIPFGPGPVFVAQLTLNGSLAEKGLSHQQKKVGIGVLHQMLTEGLKFFGHEVASDLMPGMVVRVMVPHAPVDSPPRNIGVVEGMFGELLLLSTFNDKAEKKVIRIPSLQFVVEQVPGYMGMEGLRQLLWDEVTEELLPDELRKALHCQKEKSMGWVGIEDEAGMKEVDQSEVDSLLAAVDEVETAPISDDEVDSLLAAVDADDGEEEGSQSEVDAILAEVDSGESLSRGERDVLDEMARETALPLSMVKELDRTTRQRDQLLEMAQSAPCIRHISGALQIAAARKSSDVHFETREEAMHVRIREKGRLFTLCEYPLHLSPAIIARLKVLAKLHIEDCEYTQEGVVSLKVAGVDRNLRVLVHPGLFGESAIVHFLTDEDAKEALTPIARGDQSQSKEIRELFLTPFTGNYLDRYKFTPAARALDTLIHEATKRTATVISFTNDAEGMKVRINVRDTRDVWSLPSDCTIEALCEYVKVMAKIDIAEQRMKQNGTFMCIGCEDDDGDDGLVRCSVETFINEHGENIAIALMY